MPVSSQIVTNISKEPNKFIFGIIYVLRKCNGYFVFINISTESFFKT